MQSWQAKMQALNWNDLRYVLAVSRGKSLAAAARTLAVNESTVARRIVVIEKQLSTQLFERNSGVLLPTRAGELAMLAAERVELETQGLESAVSGADQRIAGTVRLTSVPLIINHLLVPAVNELCNQHPELSLELIAESRDLSLSKRESDIALRLARPTKELKVLAQRIGKLDYAVYALKSANAARLPWINYEDGMRDLPQAQWINSRIDSAIPGTYILGNDAEVILACIKAGLGKSLLPVAVGDQQADLQRINSSVPVSREIWLLVHPDLRQLARIKVVVDWLAGVAEKLQVK
ncbi:MAG: LysR family transcriptional regulator [Gammaproteobacteria bacterium]|nr:LysR family transcriptional regulator [Gammaproteobacteria bacterium]